MRSSLVTTHWPRQSASAICLPIQILLVVYASAILQCFFWLTSNSHRHTRRRIKYPKLRRTEAECSPNFLQKVVGCRGERMPTVCLPDSITLNGSAVSGAVQATIVRIPGQAPKPFVGKWIPPSHTYGASHVHARSGRSWSFIVRYTIFS